MLTTQTTTRSGKAKKIARTNQEKNYSYFPFVHFKKKFGWAEHVCYEGNTVSLIALYKNIPHYLQKQVDQLLLEEYRKKLFDIPLFKASLLLLSKGCLPGFQSLKERSEQVFFENNLQIEQERGLDYISSRNQDDIVVLVLKSGKLVATMTLFPFNKRQDLPSLSYLKLDSSFEQLPDVPAIEIGRLARLSSNGYNSTDRRNNITNSAAIASALVVGRDFVLNNGLLNDADSYVCGTTYESFILNLKRYFPLITLNSKVNKDMLEDDSKARGMAMYFIQRYVLGSFKDGNDLASVVQEISNKHPHIADQIQELIASSKNANGVQSIEGFKPKRFRVGFFYCKFGHPKTLDGIKRLERISQKLTAWSNNEFNWMKQESSLLKHKPIYFH
ncbi:MAG: hypothetical protein SWO11_03240 [Thermodesulfobacteriota bacterium]|nr:hypothetical protein [Thermodesulfobacteriota bacterium]